MHQRNTSRRLPQICTSRHLTGHLSPLPAYQSHPDHSGTSAQPSAFIFKCLIFLDSFRNSSLSRTPTGNDGDEQIQRFPLAHSGRSVFPVPEPDVPTAEPAGRCACLSKLWNEAGSRSSYSKFFIFFFFHVVHRGRTTRTRMFTHRPM